MTKQDIHQLLVRQLANELEAITAAAKSSFSTATNAAHHAEGKYDTFSLETSYLARGQAKRVVELREALERLQLLPMKTLGASAPVQLSALVRLEGADGETRSLFFGSAGGGEKISVEGEEIVVVTSQSPLGRAMLGRTVGEHFEIVIAGKRQTFTVISID
jgi:transcription elongation GreA/GreB family factor